MKIDLDPNSPTFGRIAYHSIRFRDDGGTDFVQFDFDGKEESRVQHTPAVKDDPRYQKIFARSYFP